MLVLVIFFGFYVGGWHSQKIDLLNPHRLYMVAQQAISFLSVFIALLAVLLLTHEFRYNTITYTLTLSNSRNKVLLSKVVVVSVIALIATAVIGSLSPMLAYWGIHANHLHLVAQHFYYSDLLWKGLVFGWGYSMAALVIAILIRNQIGAIVALLLIPTTVEGLLSVWLKSNTDYLPFSALHTMLGAGTDVQKSGLNPINAMYVFLGYLVFSGAIAWFSFIKRDAN
jgi:ABC-type transport system involved in multi-copper enzyme maturation permease subunit